MLTYARDLLIFFRASFFCPNLAFCWMLKALWKGLDCEKLKSMRDNLGTVYSSDVDSKQLYEKSRDCKMLVSSGVTQNYRVLMSWHSSNCFANNADDVSYTVFTASCKDLSVNWNWFFHTSGPRWLTISQGSLCDIALMRIERDETEKAYFDEIIDQVASIKARKVLFCFN